MISQDNLCRFFQSAQAVDNITLKIEKGEIIGLLGPNGVRKSTIIKMLTIMLSPSGDAANIFDHDIIQEMNVARSYIGVAFKDATLDSKLNSKENLDVHAQIYGVGRDVCRKRIDNILDKVDKREIEPFDDPISRWRHRGRRS